MRFAGISLEDTSPHVLTLNVGPGHPRARPSLWGWREERHPPVGRFADSCGHRPHQHRATAADKTVTTGEDRACAFTADDFGFDDADAGDTLASVTIVTQPALGTLALDYTAVMDPATSSPRPRSTDMLTFTPARDAHGDPYTSPSR